MCIRDRLTVVVVLMLEDLEVRNGQGAGDFSLPSSPSSFVVEEIGVTLVEEA